MDKSPSVLLLAYFFPPANDSACGRTWNIARCLARSGWRVFVATPHPSLWRYVCEVDKVERALRKDGIQRVLTGHRWRCLTPDHLKCRDGGVGWIIGGICRRIARGLRIDPGTGWTYPAEAACSALKGEIDVVLASGPPSVPFKVAQRIAGRLRCPFVLDYHDPWSGNPHTRFSPEALEQESRLVSDAAAVSIVTESWAQAMDASFRLGPKLHVIPSGYDSEALQHVRPLDFGHPAIVYAGTFYPPKRTISPVMAALQRLGRRRAGDDRDWCFHYYGIHGEHVREEAERFGVSDRVRLHGRVSQSEALSAVKGSRVAVVVTSVLQGCTLQDQGIVPAKVFEGLGCRRPMLVVSPPGGDVDKLAALTGSIRVFSGGEVEGMAAFLNEAIAGRIPAGKNVPQYEWENVLKRLDPILRQTLAPFPFRRTAPAPRTVAGTGSRCRPPGVTQM